MTRAGQLDRRVVFQQRALVGAVRNGDWTAVVTRDARIQPLKGGEAVQAARMSGRQPVIIAVRRDAVTAAIDNSYRAVDARDATQVWDVVSKILTEDRAWVELQAIQRLGTDE